MLNIKFSSLFIGLCGRSRSQNIIVYCEHWLPFQSFYRNNEVAETDSGTPSVLCRLQLYDVITSLSLCMHSVVFLEVIFIMPLSCSALISSLALNHHQDLSCRWHTVVYFLFCSSQGSLPEYLPCLIPAVVRVTCCKLLGIFIDSNLRFSEQVDQLIKICSQRFYLLQLMQSKR